MLFCWSWSHAVLAMPILTHDLGADLAAATRDNVPLVLFVTQPNCPFCERARREFFAPMAREAAEKAADKAVPKAGVGKPLLLRELATGTLPLVRRPDGSHATPLSIAKRYGVRVFPTVVIVDGSGKLLVEPIEGVQLPDFYQSYIDEAIARAQAALTTNSPPPAK